jgi:hypothetical protein
VWLFVAGRQGDRMRDLDEIFERLAKSPFRKHFRPGAKGYVLLGIGGLLWLLGII